jgi:hypothetical protein
VTGRYDEWAAARAPSLLRFARALVDDRDRPPARAEQAVRRALRDVETRWDRVVRRDDPDLVARARVVRSLVHGQAGRRRAAAVLRSLEDRSDAEIADVLGCSESAARGHLARGLTQTTFTPAAEDDRVSAVAVLIRAPDRDQAGGGARPRRRGGAWPTALAVLALVGGIAVVDRLTATPPGVITYPNVQAPTGWRTESYAGVQVQVPATWGWGGAPFRSDIFGRSRLGGCGSDSAAVRSPVDPTSFVSSRTPFVGRPAQLSYRCAPWGSDGVVPHTDAVWLGSMLPIGVRTVDRVVAETRAVGAQRVTVFSDRAGLRRQILGTVRAVTLDSNGCPTAPVLRASPGAPPASPTSLSVCVYSQDSGTARLEWSGRVSDVAARRYEADISSAATRRDSCPTPSGQWVAIGVHGDGAAVRWDLAVPRCAAIETGTGQAPMTVETVRDWAVGGVAAYVDGPRDPSVAAFFRPSLGGRTY